jgi:hypothetical protein
MRSLPVGFACFCLSLGCAPNLPTAPGWIRYGGTDSGTIVDPWTDYPKPLAEAAHRCQQKLYNNVKAAKKAYRINNALTITGGSVSIAGGATSAIIGATVADTSTQAKAAAVASAVVGAVAGVVTLLSKVGQQADAPLKQFGLREAHYTTARTLMDEYPVKVKDVESPVYRRVVREFNACASDDPKPVQDEVSTADTRPVAQTFQKLTQGQSIRTKQLELAPGAYEFVVSGAGSSICKFYSAPANGTAGCSPPPTGNKWTGVFALIKCTDDDQCSDLLPNFQNLRDDFDAVSYSANVSIDTAGKYYFKFETRGSDPLDLWFNPSLQLNVVSKN